MRIIDQAMQEHLHEELNDEFKIQTWDMFTKTAQNKKLWVFGVGEGADFFLGKYGEQFSVAGFIDNDKRKQGHKVSEFLGNELITSDIAVLAPEHIVQELQNGAVVLITSIRYFSDIYSQLKKMGATIVFSLFAMEVNARLANGKNANNTSAEYEYAIECLKLPIEKNKVLLARDECGGHGKAILLQLLQIEPNLDLVWVDDRDVMDLPDGIRVIRTSDRRAYIRELETAHIWLFGDMIPEYAVKRREQIYIQIKHWSSITLKKFYMDLPNYLDIPSIKRYYVHNNESMDYIFVGSKFDEASCRSGFNFYGECIHVGSPRSDILFKKGIKERVLKKLGINRVNHVLLYAPTFRARSSRTVVGCMRDVDIDFYRVRQALQRRFSGEWQILMRIHPDVAIESNSVILPDFVTNVSFYPDSQELIAASDIVVSDYSSIMFEPAFIARPVFRYAPDLSDYINKERSVLLDYNELPFPLATSNDELEKCILNFDEMKYKSDLQKMLKTYGVKEDGKASERAAQFVLQLLKQGERNL